ncbi:MAG: ATP-binding protein [Rhodospirillales bacterium]|nr:ATP-binding protein [Rhodospirillales bacterium]MDP7215389.1 ATP-binding protein [Rhodospirillales bacterium]HIJ43261.1 HAMP domain-containing histidine kinase [Rhodospirillaceae bacterium]
MSRSGKRILWRNTSKLYRHPLTVSNAVLEANADVIAMHRHMKDVVLARNAEDLELAISKVDAAKKHVYMHFKTVLDRFLGDKSRIMETRKAFSDWKAIRSEVIELTRAAKYGEAAAITKGKGAKHVVLLTVQMDGLIGFARDKAAEFLEDSKREQERSRTFLYGMLVVLVLVCGTIAYFMVGRVRRAENRILEAMNEAKVANQAKSEFLASMSHDLRTPLNAIMGFAEMMEVKTFGPLGDPHYEEYAKDIHNGGNLLVSLIDDILDISKIEAGKYELDEETLDVSMIVQSSVKMIATLAEARKLHLATDMEPNLPMLLGDKRAITQILNNLLSNAVKFTPADGKVTVSAKLDGDGSINVLVADTGEGMSSHDIAKALNPFEQADSVHARRHEGTGLGLCLCQKLIRLHDGDIMLQSKAGKGTTVTLHFPPERTVVS